MTGIGDVNVARDGNRSGNVKQLIFVALRKRLTLLDIGIRCGSGPVQTVGVGLAGAVICRGVLRDGFRDGIDADAIGLSLSVPRHRHIPGDRDCSGDERFVGVIALRHSLLILDEVDVVPDTRLARSCCLYWSG